MELASESRVWYVRGDYGSYRLCSQELPGTESAWKRQRNWQQSGPGPIKPPRQQVTRDCGRPVVATAMTCSVRDFEGFSTAGEVRSNPRIQVHSHHKCITDAQ